MTKKASNSPRGGLTGVEAHRPADGKAGDGGPAKERRRKADAAIATTSVLSTAVEESETAEERTLRVKNWMADKVEPLKTRNEIRAENAGTSSVATPSNSMRPTVQLRWRQVGQNKVEQGPHGEPVQRLANRFLQQLWEDESGGLEWRDVPTVTDGRPRS